MKKLNQQGYNLVELLIAVGILAVLASSVMVARSYMAKQTVKAEDKAYASQKAIQMFEELKALVNGSEKLGVAVLDQYSDGLSYNTVLTTDQLVDTRLPGANPYDPLSGNRLTNGHNRYVRQIQVNHVANDPWTRQVIIKVWQYGSDGAPTQPGPLLSTVGGYLRTISDVAPPTQVLDLYCLALSNVLGWFTTIPTMSQTFDKVATDIQARNPGLELRVHKIQQTGYGRDPYYRPAINVAQDTTFAASLPFVYFYPGLSPQDALDGGSDAMFFDNNELQQIGNISVDRALKNSPNGTSMCDMYNADMRYPDAVSLFNSLTSQWAATHTPYIPEAGPAPTLRILLEQMNSTQNFKNALLISMHGEALPMPNMRNYSDPAKDPANNSLMRVVTHPQMLHSKTGRAVTLRVYGYYDGLMNPSGLDTDTSGRTTPGNQAATITLYFPALYMQPADFNFTAITGGVSNSAVSTPYASLSVSPGVTYPTGVSISISHPTSPGNVDTLVTLYNTPLRCPPVVSGGITTGLDPGAQLYDCEYIPCPVDSNWSYITDLTVPGSGPKNTARWIVTLKTQNGGFAIADGQYAVETRIGNDLTTGTATGPSNELSNLSRTFIWLGTGSGAVGTSTSGITPWTERFQYNGDPRHEPYLDAKFGTANIDSTDAAVTIDQDSYNWYFRNFNLSNGYSGFAKAQNGYNGDSTYRDLRDIPRYYYTYRHGLLNNTAIYGNLNGYSFWHASEGGEIGSTYQPFNSSLQFNNLPWDPGVPSAIVSIDEIQNSNNYTSSAGAGVCRDVMFYLPGGDTNPASVWAARTWEGELYPDDWFANYWLPIGNLPTVVGTGPSAQGFWRVPLDQINNGVTQYLDGYDVNRDYEWGVGGTAPAAFMNAWTSTGNNYGFMHTTASSSATVQQLGLNNYLITNYPMDSPLVSSRPWAWNKQLTALPPEWGDSYYDDETKGRRTTIKMPNVGGIDRIFYDAPNASGVSWLTSGAVQMSVTFPTNQTSYFTFSGLAPQGNYDPSGLGKITLAMLIRTFLDGGNYAGVNHIPQLPLMKLYVNSPSTQYPYPNNSNYMVAVTLTSPVTLTTGSAIANIWFRYPGISSSVANFYTEEYPGYTTSGPLTASTYTEASAANLWVSFKYSTDEANWKFVSDGAPATIGVYDGTVAGHGITVASNAPVTTTWDVSNAANFPQGTYWLRAEIYRPNYPLHYSYHNLEITVNR